MPAAVCPFFLTAEQSVPLALTAGKAFGRDESEDLPSDEFLLYAELGNRLAKRVDLTIK